MVKAYSYIRFSTPEQAKGDSLRRQLASAEAWCSERNIDLDDSLRDLGVSAFKGFHRTQGALRSFLEKVDKGQVEKGSYLIIESLDRLSREDVLSAAQQLLSLISAGIIVVTLIDGQEYSSERLKQDWTPLIVSLALMARSHDESRVKSIRVSRAWHQKKELARREKKPLTSRCPEWMELVGGSFRLRNDRVQIVQRIFRETIEGAGRREIVKRLNEEGVPAFRGSAGWQTSSVAKIVTSRAVLGEYQPHTGSHRNRDRKPSGEPILGYYPQIIDRQTYILAQDAIERRKQRAAGRKGTRVHLLQNLAKCGGCGSSMHIINKGRPPKGGTYLSCSNFLRGMGCANARRWRVDKLENALISALGFLDAQAFGPIDETVTAARRNLEVATAELRLAAAKKERWGDMLDDPLLADDVDARRRYAAAVSEMAAIRSKVTAAREEIDRLNATPAPIDRLAKLASLTSRLDDAESERRRRLRIHLSEILRNVISHVECVQDIGAIMVIKQDLRVRTLEGTTPFAFRAKNHTWEALLDTDAIAVDAFLGQSPSEWE